MKINKAKLLVGTLAVAAVAATVGSISGTVAWFQYSTRSTVAYSGAAAHVSENLQIRLFKAGQEAQGEQGQPGYVPAVEENSTEWKADLTIADVQGFIKKERGNVEDYNLRPITSGAALTAEGKVATSFYKNPIYQYSGDYENSYWEAADAKDYVELPIELRVLDRNGESTDEYLAKKIYLSDLTIAAKANGSKKDITPALRVSFVAGEGTSAKSATFSQNGGEIATTGSLDLNADGNPDKEEGYEWEDPAPSTFVYGTANSKEVTTEIKESTSTVNTFIADDSNPKEIIGNEIGSTTADAVLKVTIRIYLEGWQPLDSETLTGDTTYESLQTLQAAREAAEDKSAFNTTTYKIGDKFYKWDATASDNAGAYVEVTAKQSAVWGDDDYVGSSFNVGLRFTAEAHEDHAA